MTEYIVPYQDAESEFTEKRSRFITHLYKVETEAEARARIEEMKKKYYDARHNCWCYLLQEGGVVRYSDDGEPQGTAGQPMLNVFQRQEVWNVCCVVTRYFGGVLLGAGGLTRAYTKGAKDALDAAGIQTKGDLVFVGTVEEEGIGSFGGMLKWLDDNQVDASISIDGPSAEGITYEATGHMTCEATFHGIGGHAHGAFGKVANPLNAAARAVAKIAEFQVPTDPKTSFCVSNFHAGNDAGIHAIVPEATIKFNLRSDSQEVLEELYQRILNALQEACDEETARWGKDTITVTHKRYCNVPAGTQDVHSPIVEATYAISSYLGYEPIFFHGGSTNCNMAIGKNIPAVCLGMGSLDCGAHTLQEFFETTDAHKGVQQALLLALLLAGVDGATDSILA